MSDKETRYEHSSYGLISFSRFNGVTNFFGVEPTLSGGISMTIHAAEVNHDLNRDWYFGRSRLVEIEMSAHQFAELITNMNRGPGIPCTIKHIAGHDIEKYVPMPTVREKFDENLTDSLSELERRAAALHQEIADLKNDKGKAGKKDLEVLTGKAEMLLRQIKSNLPFLTQSFSEQLDNQVLKAKVEFTAYVDSQVYAHGLDALGIQATLPAAEESPEQVDTPRPEGAGILGSLTGLN